MAAINFAPVGRLGGVVRVQRRSDAASFQVSGRGPSLALARPSSAARLTVTARAATNTTYICVDCGYLYDGSEGPWDKLPNSYKCPVCNSPKRRFKSYAGSGRNDAKSMQSRMKQLKGGGGSGASSSSSSGGSDTGGAVAIVVGGAVLLAALYFGLNATYN